MIKRLTLAALLAMALLPRGFSQQPPPLRNSLGRRTLPVGGVAFAEGPVFDSKDDLYFTNYMKEGTIGQMAPDGTLRVWFTLDRGAPNGLRVDAEDRIVVADQDGGRLRRVSADGKRQETLVETYEGKPINGPNDIIIDNKGNIYFTDPKGSSARKPIGAIYRLGTDGKLKRLLDGLAFPNGLALTPDEKSLFYDESDASRLSAFDLTPNGGIANQRSVAQFLPHGLDGIHFDEYGRLWIAHYTARSVEVVTQTGELLKSYDIGADQVSNLVFHKGKLYVTATGDQCVYMYDVGLNGLEQ
jgi:sugar lactone lactonase YvrE